MASLTLGRGSAEIQVKAGMQAELKALQSQGLEELVYAYVSCMAVKTDYRRKGVATALLKAAEIQVSLSAHLLLPSSHVLRSQQADSGGQECSLLMCSLSCVLADKLSDRCVLLQAGRWKQNWVLLHVYSDNTTGVSLYERTGYSLIFQDPEWQKVFGRRQRKLLAKGATASGAAGAIMSISENVMRLWQQPDQRSTAHADS